MPGAAPTESVSHPINGGLVALPMAKALYSVPIRPPSRSGPNSRASTAGASATNPPYPVPISTENSTKAATELPANSHTAKLQAMRAWHS